MTRIPGETSAAGQLRDVHGRRELVAKALNDPLLPTDVPTSLGVVDVDGREQIVLVDSTGAFSGIDDSINVWDHGAKMDGNVTTANMTSGSGLITKSVFVTADVGKLIHVAGAGVAGADLLTTIASVVSGVSATTTVAASTSVVGATVTWGTDDQPAWQAAINAARTTRGGNVIATPPPVPAVAFTSSYYSLLGSTVTISHWKGGLIKGSSAGGQAFPLINYLPATGSAFHATSCLNLAFEDLTFFAGNSNFTGDLVLLDSDGTDNMACSFLRCGFSAGPTQAPNARSLLRLEKTIFSHVDLCSFGAGATAAIQFGNTASVGYAVNCTVKRSNFSHTANHILIDNADTESLTIEDNTFEPCYGGTAGAIVGAVGNRVRGGLVIRNNWFGDFTVGGRCHIENVDAWIAGAEISGNTFNSPIDQAGSGFGGAHFGKLGGGPWEIHSNYMAGGVSLMDLTACTGADVGRPFNVHFHDNTVVQSTNVFTNGLLSDLSGWKFDEDNNTASGAITTLWPWTPRPNNRPPLVGSSYYPHTLDWNDIGRTIYTVNNGTQMEITIPAEATTYFMPGTIIDFVQQGAGKVHFNVAGGVALNSKGALVLSNGVSSTCRLTKTSVANTWLLTGDLS